MCNPAISKDLILDNELEIVVKLAAAECYAVHSRGNNDRLLLDIGMNKQNFRLAGASPTYLPPDSLDANKIVAREAALADIWNFVNDIDFARLENLDKTCDPDNFLETLLFTVKNESISYQSFIKKEKQKLIKMLCNNLAVAKTVIPQCQDTIAALEA